MRTIIGIDPGQEGALVMIPPGVPEGSHLGIVVRDTPVLATKNAAGKARTIYDEVQMASELRDLVSRAPVRTEVLVVIEQVHSMPKQGVASSFTFGMGYGIWLGIIAALGIPSHRVTPQRWKKEVLADGPKTDQAVVAFAARLYPSVRPDLQTPRGRLLLGRADALLIAHWGRSHAPPTA